MITKPEIKKLWTCPKCKRQFERRWQTHSCKSFPLEQHFEGKATGKALYEKFKRAVKKTIGPFKIESLECCIHFMSTFTFTAVKILKEKIRVDFSLSRKLKSKRIHQMVPMSANRYLYVIDVDKEDDIDDELLGWIHEAHDKKRQKAESNKLITKPKAAVSK